MQLCAGGQHHNDIVSIFHEGLGQIHLCGRTALENADLGLVPVKKFLQRGRNHTERLEK